MGIKNLFGWYKNNFTDCYTKMDCTQNFCEESISLDVDNLLLDLNGIFHTAAQKAFRYGEYSDKPRFLIKPKTYNQSKMFCFREVCSIVDRIVNMVRPMKRIILCIDGVAPLSKQNQQRQRRFRAATENKCIFDSNSITPGTLFMDQLSRYIDWYIKRKITRDINWKELEIIFSNEKCPGEGEHKLIAYIRKYGKIEESYCIEGMDADLIMLSLGTHYPNFYILRMDSFNPREYFILDIGKTSLRLKEKMRWEDESEYVYDSNRAIDDFILCCFSVGNDFLSHIPGIEVRREGIDRMIDIYKEIGESYGHLTTRDANRIRFNKESLGVFFGSMDREAKEILQTKLEYKGKFYDDEILFESATQKEDGKWEVDMELYKKKYYKNHTRNSVSNSENEIKRMCLEYLTGVYWVLNYYMYGPISWTWKYPYNYAPFASSLSQYITDFRIPLYGKTYPSLPFIQLLCVLPPKSYQLLPKALQPLLNDEKSPLQKFCPKTLSIDYSGMTHDWEGIVILPNLSLTIVNSEYRKLRDNISEKDHKRNLRGISFKYTYTQREQEVYNYYGNFLSNANVEKIIF